MFFIVVKSNTLCSSGVEGIFLVGGGTVYDVIKKESRVHAHSELFSVQCCNLPNMETWVNLNCKNQHV